MEMVKENLLEEPILEPKLEGEGWIFQVDSASRGQRYGKMKQPGAIRNVGFYPIFLMGLWEPHAKTHIVNCQQVL